MSHERIGVHCEDPVQRYAAHCCGDDALSPMPPAAPPPPPRAYSQRSCGELGWQVDPRVDPTQFGVCASAAINGECIANVPWATAQNYCEDVGARLCTFREMVATRHDTGPYGRCPFFDDALLWTSTMCGPDYHLIAHAHSGYAACVHSFEIEVPELLQVELRFDPEEYKSVWQEAQQLCVDSGARLCTQSELRMTGDSGCGMEDATVWTWDKCESAHGAQEGHQVGSGREGSHTTCSADHIPNAVRCCADSQWVGIGLPPEEDDTLESVVAGIMTVVIFFGCIGLYKLVGVYRRRGKDGDGIGLLRAAKDSIAPKLRTPNLRGLVEMRPGKMRSRTVPGEELYDEDEDEDVSTRRESMQDLDGLLNAPPERDEEEEDVGDNGSGSKANGRSMEEMHPELEPTTASKPRWSWDDGGTRPPTSSSSRSRAPDAGDMDDDDDAAFATMRL